MEQKEKKLPSEAADIATAILYEKMELEQKGLKPRVVLISTKMHDQLLGEWLESWRELPWGDTIAYELEKDAERNRNIFLGDGVMFDLWVVRVDTISGFEVR
jgi:hypothetical protein